MRIKIGDQVRWVGMKFRPELRLGTVVAIDNSSCMMKIFWGDAYYLSWYSIDNQLLQFHFCYENHDSVND